jgi:N-acyl-D-aspartate/D-glutamate deacylase
VAHDLVIRGGLVVDGTGAPAVRADVAVRADRIVEVGRVAERGARELDADGRIVTPGFVDVHTHLDAQIAWDPVASSSCWHGVTSVVLGNCGVTFAPCRAEDRAYLAALMESVEDIPAASVLEGLRWDWETYGEYLGALDRLPKGVNVGGMVGHCAVRQHVMGDRSLSEDPATPDEVAAMAELVEEAVAAGALGVSTSRTLLHRVPDGRPVPGTWARDDELLAFAEVLGRLRRGVFEVAPRFEGRGLEGDPAREEVAWMAEAQRRSGRPVTFGVAQSDLGPDLYRRIYDHVDEQGRRGAELRPQTTPRGIALLFGLAARTLFDRSPAWQELRALDLPARLAAVDDEARRARLVDDGRANLPSLDFTGVFVLAGEPARYDFGPADSLAAHAAAAGEDVVEAFVRISRETRGRALFSFPFLNQRMEAVDWMLHHPRTVLGLGDSGAHVGLIMDAGQPTWFLSHWARDRGVFTVEDAVRRLTSDTAGLFGLADRGVVRAGAHADLNVIDLDALALSLPAYVRDFPGGAGRYVQRASGYDATVVNGAVFMEHGEHTGSLAGVTLRSAPV